MLTRHELKIKAAKRYYYPDYTLSASYGLRTGKRDFFSLSVSIPVYTHKRVNQDAKVQAEYAGMEVSGAERAVLANELATQLHQSALELERLVELGSLYRNELVPQARLVLESTASSYAANQGDLAALLNAQQELLNFELELRMMSLDYLALLRELQVLSAGAFDPAPYFSDTVIARSLPEERTQ